MGVGVGADTMQTGAVQAEFVQPHWVIAIHQDVCEVLILGLAAVNGSGVAIAGIGVRKGDTGWSCGVGVSPCSVRCGGGSGRQVGLRLQLAKNARSV